LSRLQAEPSVALNAPSVADTRSGRTEGVTRNVNGATQFVPRVDSQWKTSEAF